MRDAGEDISKHGIDYIIHVIEYQHRGLPHAHIVVRLKNVGISAAEQLLWIDKYITAKLPTRQERVDPVKETGYQLIKQFMTHKHGQPNAVNSCQRPDGTCKSGFDKTVIVPSTILDSRGFPIYQRLRTEDLCIVPTNIELLIDWDDHANVEWTGSTYCCIYLYKYIVKGSKKEKFRLTNADDVLENDEHNLYLRARVISSMDAMWRVLGFQTYPAASPSVFKVKVKIPSDLDHLAKDNKISDLTIYFNRPRTESMQSLLFTQFFDIYRYDNKLPARYKEYDNHQDIEHYKVNLYLAPNKPEKVHFSTNKFK